MISLRRWRILRTTCKTWDILLDTHILLWHLADNPRLSREKSALIEDPQNRKLFSIASLWEIAIKRGLGKLETDQPLHLLVPDEILLLPIQILHLQQVEILPLHHRDPFDRLLIAQALSEDFFIMTDDERFLDYGVKLI